MPASGGCDRMGRYRLGCRLATIFALSVTSTAVPAAEFRTDDPLRAFVHGEYAPGSDYFIGGTTNTVLFRCALPTREHPFTGIALSEQSIWGNRGGDWGLFHGTSAGGYVYVGTGQIGDTGCLESCRSRDYLATGRCKWTKGWPK